MLCSSSSSSINNTSRTSSFQCLGAALTGRQQTRGVSSNRRTQKVLRVQPHESFAKTAATQDHIIFNPPSSAPNVYHTPLKFLPPNDPRRKLHSLAARTSSAPASSLHPTTTSESARSLPPSVRPIQEKKYHLSAEHVEEIRRLRAEDPRLWTRVRLAEKFGCSTFFVGLCASAPQIADERKKELEEIKKRWGRAKKEAREDRQTRKQLWGRE